MTTCVLIVHMHMYMYIHVPMDIRTCKLGCFIYIRRERGRNTSVQGEDYSFTELYVHLSLNCFFLSIASICDAHTYMHIQFCTSFTCM